PDHLGEAVDDFGDMIEGVGESFARGHVRLSEAGQIGRHDVEAVSKMRDEVAEHVARARKTVQQQQRRRALGPRLAVEDLEAVDGSLAVVDPGHDGSHGLNCFAYKGARRPAHLNSRRYTVGVQPVAFRKVLLNELVWAYPKLRAISVTELVRLVSSDFATSMR